MSKNNITVQTIANEVGVSVTTVSRVMNGVAKKYRISDKTIETVKTTADRLKYSPNIIAQSLRLKKTFTIGLIVPDISNPWFAKIARGIEKELRKKNYNVTLCNSNDDIAIEIKSLKLLQDMKVDGIVIAPIGIHYDHLIESYKDGTPIVLVDRFFEQFDIPYVSSDDFEGAYQANNYLIQNGHKKIACIQGLVGTSSNSKRIEGYKEALNKNDIQFHSEYLVGYDFSMRNGYEQAKKLIENYDKSRITAIFSTGSQITLGILKAFKEENIGIPEDISLISYDEQEYSELLYTPLTTVAHFDKNIGEIAINLLFNQINKYQDLSETRVLCSPHLIKRESVKNLSL